MIQSARLRTQKILDVTEELMAFYGKLNGIQETANSIR
ncbi:MAG: hypothetical protein QG650_294 [Patescibacteria group bacterium]|nr:hypothetical protein [Patescibacteria group bacterium]